MKGHLWLDATYLKIRSNHRFDWRTRDPGLCYKSEPFWYEFLKDLISRGLSGVQLVISDAHEGLKNAIQKALMGASWQCISCKMLCREELSKLLPPTGATMVLPPVD